MDLASDVFVVPELRVAAFQDLLQQEKKESRIRLTFYPPRGTPISILASPDAQLGVAIQETGLVYFSFEDHIIFAEVNDRPDEVAVVPGILCRELKPLGRVRAKPRKGATPLIKSEEGKDVGDESDANFFYVHSTKPGITKKTVPNTAYEGKLICVIARDGDTLGDAISKDGRFSDGIMLLEDNDRQSEVPFHYQVSEFSRQNFIMKKRAPKRKKCSEKQNENPSVNFVYSLIQDNTNDKFNEEIGRAMINNARQNALETFAKPGVKGKVDDHIKRMVQEFGKKASFAIPARITETLAFAKKSVGYIHCGDYSGTCFLLSENAIITSRHVINEISALRSEATDPELCQTIFVDFGYDYPDRHGTLQTEIDEKIEAFFGQGDLDYAICFLKPSIVLGVLSPLGPLVRTRLPKIRRVVLMGHPEKECKLLEVCQIIPGYKWQETICERASEANHYCQQNPNECQMVSDQNVQCIHMLKDSDILNDSHSNHVPYHTSFFHGSSGSPVFNADGHIIAMHTMGYPYFQRSTKFSLMEFGTTFSAIYRDLKMRHGDQIANYFLPGCQD